MPMVTLLTNMAGPNGVAHAGTVLNVTKAEADELLDGNEGGGPYARPYNPKADEKAKKGLVKYQRDPNE